jgi:hypothetical protein
MVFSLARPSLFGNFLGRPIRAFMAGLMLLAGLILLAACANLGSLFAARAADRSREVALRLALGASRARILRQLFTESVLLSIAGGAVGLAASLALLRALGAWQPFSRFPVHVPVAPDATVYGVALVLALASGLLFGAVPIRQVLHTNPYEIVKSGSIGRAGRRLTARDVLVVQSRSAPARDPSFVAVRGRWGAAQQLRIEPQHALLINRSWDGRLLQRRFMPEMRRRMVTPWDRSRASSPPRMSTNRRLRWIPCSQRCSPMTPRSSKRTKPLPIRSLQRVARLLPRGGHDDRLGPRFSGDDDDAPRVAIVNREFARRVFGVSESARPHFKRRDGTLSSGRRRRRRQLFQPDGKPGIGMFFPGAASATPETWLVLHTTGDPLPSPTPPARCAISTPDCPSTFRLGEVAGWRCPSRAATARRARMGAMPRSPASSAWRPTRERGCASWYPHRAWRGAERKAVRLGRAVKLP